MYLVATKTAITQALEEVFADHPNTDFQGENRPNVSMEYPVEQSHYPGLWVQYADNRELRTAGIGHTEQIVDVDEETVTTYSRWTFSGTATITVVALTNFERDRLYDEVVRTFISARFNSELSPFRNYIENNPLIAMQANFDDLQPFGDNAALGTPWGTDEPIYEKSLSFDLIGEFLTDARVRTLVPLSEVTFMKYVEGSEEPDWPGDPGSTTAPVTPGDWDRTSWS